MLFLIPFLIINLFFIVLSILPHFYRKDNKVIMVSYVINLSFYLIIFVLIYSLIKSRFITINLLIIPALLYLYYLNKNELSVRLKITKKELRYLLQILIIANSVFLLKTITLYQSLDVLKIAHPDYIYYAKVSTNLEKIGIESGILSSLTQPVPYHYFELWLNAIWVEFGLNSYNSLMLITYTILVTYCYLLSLSLFCKFEEYKKHFFAFSILFIQFVFVPQLYEKITFINDASSFFYSLWSYQKLSVVYFVFLLSFVIYRFSTFNNFLFTLSISIFIYGSLLFGLVGIFGGVIILKVFKNNSIKWSGLFILFLSIISYQLFYKLNNYENKLIPLINIEFIKTSINIIGGTIIRFGILLLPFFIIFIFKFKEIKKNILSHFNFTFVLFLGIITSLFGWVLLHLQIDSVQVFSNFSIPIICIAVILLARFFDYRIFFTLVLIITALNISKYTFGTNNISINNYGVLKGKGVFIKDITDYEHAFSINPYFSNPLNNVFLLKNNVTFIDLSMVDVDLNKTKYPSAISSYLKFNELKNYSEKNNLKGIDAKVEFVKNNNIDFMVCKSCYSLNKKFIDLFSKKCKIEGYDVYYK